MLAAIGRRMRGIVTPSALLRAQFLYGGFGIL